ncbi:MAG: hypothetical protein JO046_21355 [Solirubrobacterales bacterium]|nr:hypothetical protein [Solirubrobacterales bacterium]
MPFAGLFAAWGILPATIYPVAALARSQNVSTGAHALERTADGRWVRIEAARLAGQPDAQIAVTLRAATSRETFDLLCRAYALSRREREVVAALLAGLDTRAVSARLCVSPHTVQDHLKSVFRKTEAHSRRELLAHFSRADASQQGAAMGLLEQRRRRSQRRREGGHYAKSGRDGPSVAHATTAGRLLLRALAGVKQQPDHSWQPPASRPVVRGSRIARRLDGTPEVAQQDE